MNLLVLDTETTGLQEDPDARVIEVACALYSVTKRVVLRAFGALLPYDGDNPAERVNGISTAALGEAGVAHELACGHFPTASDPLAVLRRELAMYQPIAVAAHNAGFDREMLGRHDGWWLKQSWICTADDVRYPVQRSRSLAHLCVDNGIVALQTHRALDDVLMLCDLLSRAEDLAEQVRVALLPRALWAADVSYDDRQLAKDAGFYWAPNAKEWRREMPINVFEHPDLPFEVTQVRVVEDRWRRD